MLDSTILDKNNKISPIQLQYLIFIQLLQKSKYCSYAIAS